MIPENELELTSETTITTEKQKFVVGDREEPLDVLHYLNDFGQIDSVTKITGGLYDSGKNYVDISCPSGQSDMCIINLKRDLPRDKSNF